MNYTIYLTDYCNMDCKYCYEKNMHIKNQIDIQFIKNIIDIEIKNKTKQCIITFFGGEPLLKKELIYEVSNYINSKNCKTKFLYNITTNATLIDDDFINFVRNNPFISISISIDGHKETQNKNRILKNNLDSYEIIEKNIINLLKVTNVLVAVPVITKNNEKNLFQNVQNLLKIGFKKISFQYDFTTTWNDQDIQILKDEFKKISNLYMEKMREEKEFEILEIDEKIYSYIDENKDVNDNCSVGLRGANIGTDGKIYPCMQFMYDDKYVIGDCNKGINKKLQLKVHKELKQELDECKNCNYRRRCNHTCSCINKAFSGKAETTSPFTCEIQRMIIEISDEIAEQMYKEKNPVFIQKYYNSSYKFIENKILNRGNLNGIKKSNESNK